MSDTTGFSLHGESRFTIIARMRRLAKNLSFNFIAVVTFFFMSESAQAQSCPDLRAFYNSDEWPLIENQLNLLLPRCLLSSEYYALLGAAQMNNLRLPQALESLERALLLDPNNGAAQIDYAQALYLQGQLFTALEINERLLRRPDLPAGLGESLAQRQESWRKLTRQYEFQGDILQGYDENLNGAPAPSSITISLPNDSVILPLDPGDRPISGPYSNFRLAGRYRQLAPDHQHNALIEVSHRLSEDESSDYTQLDARYAFIQPGRRHGVQLNTGTSHLFFGGKPLYTATDIGGRYIPGTRYSTCRFDTGISVQHQLFHNNSFLNAIESRVSVGSNCALGDMNQLEQIGFELGWIDNTPIREGRRGGARDGWQFNTTWQKQYGDGIWRALFNHTRLYDSQGYNPVLSDGAERWLRRSYVLVQYRRPFMPKTEFLMNLYYQYQDSNIELFQSRDRSFELGVSRTF